MWLNKYKLLEKTQLTDDVYELTFEAEDSFDFLPGQFVNFILPNIWGRAYSILKTQDKKIILIIKKRTQKMWWRWGSEYICNLEIWEILSWTQPAGKFLLQNNNNNKLFLWTGTGFVPLYNQIIHALEQNQDAKLELLFWARRSSDLFYISQLNNLKNKYQNFDYQVYLSNEENKNYHHWYVTKFLTENNIKLYQEYYICGIIQLIDSTIDILTSYNIDKQNIFTEKY